MATTGNEKLLYNETVRACGVKEVVEKPAVPKKPGI